MRGDNEDMHGFDAGERTLMEPPVQIEQSTRDRLMQIVAAVALGHTPEEITDHVEGGFPPAVDELLARRLECEEMSAHVDLILSAMQSGALAAAA